MLPYIYLGPMVAAKDSAFLQHEGITMLLGIRQKYGAQNKLMNGNLKVANELGIEGYTLDFADNQQLIAAFPNITKTINQHLANSRQLGQNSQTGNLATGKVLVFCESGNERSAGVVAAYLMEMYQDIDHIKAMQFCQAQRFCVNFDDGMKHVLQCYNDIIKARREVGDLRQQHHGSNTPTTAAPVPSYRAAKRGLEMDEDSSAEQDDAGDLERFERRAFAPFVDTR